MIINALKLQAECEVLLCGAPNSGKTTLFNGLTGECERVGNWYGVTTDKKKSSYMQGEKKVTVCDLPGSYFDDYTGEGRIGADYIRKNGKRCITLVLCEAACLEKGLALYKKAAAVSLKAALVINMYVELKKAGGSINLSLLKQKLGDNVIIAELNSKRGIFAVKKLIERLCCDNSTERAKTQALSSDFYTKINEKALTEKVLFLPKAKLCSFDRFALNSPLLFTFAFLSLFLVCAYIAFGEYGVGKLCSRLIEKTITSVIRKPIKQLLFNIYASEFIISFVCDGVVGSACALLEFLPPIVIMQIFVLMAEQSGVLARAAFLYDDFFSYCGLSGRAVFTILTGYGCTAAAVFCAEGLQSKRLKTTAIMTLPFIPCSAKAPIFLYILSAVSGKYAFLFVAGIYITGMLLAACFGYVNKRIKHLQKNELIIEFPPLRALDKNSLFKSLQKFIKTFIIRVGSTVFTVSLCFWLAGSVTVDFKLTTNIEQSVLCFIGKKISFLFTPIGVSDWRFSLALLAGLFAKEGVVSVLISCGGAMPAFASAASLLIFCALYSPCFAALAAIKKSAGLKYALHAFFCQNLLAYAASLLFYSALSYKKAFFLALVLFVAFAALLLAIVAFEPRRRLSLKKRY